MRSIWKGAIAFGLVNVPVNLYSATKSHDIDLHQVHDDDGGRIHYERRCEVCHEIVPYEHINKAYQEGDQTVVLTDDDFASLPAERSREITVVEFVPTEQVDPIRYAHSYYLEPSSDSPKAYALLRQTLETADRIAIVEFSLRQKSRLGALRVHNNVLVLHSLLWDDEVRDASFPVLDRKITISKKEQELSQTLIDSYASDFEPNEFTDDYQRQLRALVEKKMNRGEAFVREEAPPAETKGEVIDLLDALRRSVEKNKSKIARNG